MPTADFNLFRTKWLLRGDASPVMIFDEPRHRGLVMTVAQS